jgi:hypothetical protein
MIPGWTYYPGAIPATAHTCNRMCYSSWSAPVPPKKGPPSLYCPDLPSLLRIHQQYQQRTRPDGLQINVSNNNNSSGGSGVQGYQGAVTAVTTCGCSLPEVPPSSCWRSTGDWGRGVYVPDVLREQMGLDLPPPPAKGESSVSH